MTQPPPDLADFALEVRKSEPVGLTESLPATLISLLTVMSLSSSEPSAT